MFKKFFKILTPLILALSLVLLAGCSKTGTQKTNSKINVVSTLDFYGETAKAVLGDNGTVTSIINNPSVDPHSFEATTKTAKQVATADLVIANGAGYDSWVNKLQQKQSISVAKLMGVKDGQNEHLWYNPQAMAKLADKLAAVYAKKMPSKKTEFQKNAAKYKQKIQKLNQTLKQIKQAKGSKVVAISEPVFNYSLDKMGYTISNKHFAKAVEEENDPSYSDIKNLRKQIKTKKIAFFVYNIQSESPIVKNIVALCRKNNIPIVKVTETMPHKQTYFSWMSSQYQQVAKLNQ